MNAMHGLKTAQLIPKFVVGYTGAGGIRSNLCTVMANWALSSLSPQYNSMVPLRWNGGYASPTPASFTGLISGNILTVSGIKTGATKNLGNVQSGYILPNWIVTGSGVTAGTKVVRDVLCEFTGYISGTTLTVLSIASGQISPADKTSTGSADFVNGATAGTYIRTQTSGSAHKTGTYTISKTQNVGSAATPVVFHSYGTTASTGNGKYIVDTPQIVGAAAMSVNNPVYSAIGGFDGAASSTSYNAGSPIFSRPIDVCDAVSYAIYFFGALTGDGQQGAAGWSGTQSWYNTLFQAAADYATGVPNKMAGALNAWDLDLRSGTKNGVAPQAATLASFISNRFPYNIIPAWETCAAFYDGARPPALANLGVMWYEASLQEALQNGGTITSTELANQFDKNGWTLSPTYGSSNAEVAAKMVKLFKAYVNSSYYYNTFLYLWNQAASIHAARPFFSPSQYGVEGPGPGDVPLWGMYQGDPTTPALQNYFAAQYYNTH
jgi:hypothetical protein